jgi:hypothetical protein
MTEKGRLYPVKINGRLVCLFTFYICDKEDLYKIIKTDPWEVIEDKDSGSIAYISQLLTDKEYANRKLSYGIWKRFKDYIRKEYPSCQIIYWRRWNKHKNKVDEFIKKI